MERIEFVNDKNKSSALKGRWFRYFFNKNNIERLLMIGETDDYFYFTIMQKNGYIKGKYTINIDSEDFLFNALSSFIDGYECIEIMEEGSPEKKSIEFCKNNNSIDIVFNLTDEERVFNTIELANLRRLGDTRFGKLVPTVELEEKEFYEMESKFRYKVKSRIHHMLDEMEISYQEICEAEQERW